MKKKYILLSSIIGISLILPISYNISTNLNNDSTKFVSAEEVTEAECEVVDISQMATPVANNGAEYSSTSNDFTSVPINSTAGYLSLYKNVEIKGTYSTTAAWIAFYIRTNTTFENGIGSDNSGYMFRLYSHGQVEVAKNGVKVLGPSWGNAPSPTSGSEVPFTFKAVDLSDGTVKITLTTNGQTMFSYTDETEPITNAGGFYVRADSGTTYLKGNLVDSYDADIFDMSTPKTSTKFKASSVAEKEVKLSTGGGTGGYSGVIFETQTSGAKEFGYKVQVTPTNAAGGLYFSIAGSKQSTYYLPTDTENWTNTGYIFGWLNDGTVSLKRNGVILKESAKIGPLYRNYINEAFDVELSVKQFNQGNRVMFKINDKIIVNFFDVSTSEYTISSLPVLKSGTPASKVISNCVWSNWSGATLNSYNRDLYESKTVVSKDLGTPTSLGGTTFSINGEPETYNGTFPFGYANNLNNVSIKFNLNLTTRGTSLAFMLNYKGSIDTPNGGGWTSKGYAIYLYTNGQTILMKNGTKLMEGWSLSSKTLVVDTDYVITLESYMISDNARRIRALIGDSLVVNYIDYNSPINQTGWFTCYNTGSAGSITQTGYELPVVTANESSIFVNGTTTLSYTNPVEGDVVTYYIDEENSTGTGTIVGNTLTGTTIGDIYVYACVNGIYGDSIKVEVNSLTDLIDKYYNGGIYTKKTNINLNGDAETELKQYFHGSVDLDRTTYYKENALLMGDLDGGFANINSGYGTDALGNMTHFTWNQETQETEIDYTVTKGEHQNWKDKDIDGMEGFYVTLNDMLQEGYFDDWTGNKHKVALEEDKYISDFLAFVAPCLYETIVDTKYITIEEIVINEENHETYGDYLSIKIILNSTSSGLVDNQELILAEARIYKGNVQFDELA